MDKKEFKFQVYVCSKHKGKSITKREDISHYKKCAKQGCLSNAKYIGYVTGVVEATDWG